ncbi:MAG: magnesium transporter CorA family protein [Egibacteraceae bacterium]
MEVLTHVDPARIARLCKRDEFFWLDLLAPSTADLEMLGDLLGLHPLAIEDTSEFGQRPKVDLYDNHVLIVFYTVRADDGRALPVEVHIHISGSFIVTAHHDPCAELGRLRQMLVTETTKAEDYLVYRILDGLTDAYYPTLGHVEERVDALEDQVLARPHRRQLETVYRLEQEVHDLQRRVAAQSNMMPAAVEVVLELPGFSHGARVYLRDVSDHLAQVASELRRQNADLAALTNIYFNANTNRLNVVVTRLTIVATFFLVWTLVTSFFGQNFGWLVEHVDSRTDFLVYGIGGLVVPTILLGVYFYVRRSQWW